MMVARCLLAVVLMLALVSGGWCQQRPAGVQGAQPASPGKPQPPGGPPAAIPVPAPAAAPDKAALEAAAGLKGTDHLWEDVKRYGAKGDGKTDDTKAIQKAIDAAVTRGTKMVLVPPGVYATGNPGLRITTSDMVFKGLGYNTIIKHSGDHPALTVGSGKKPPCINVKIADLQFNGKTARKDAILLEDYTIRYYIENVCIFNFASGTAIKAVDHNHSGHISLVQLNNNAVGVSIGDHGQYTDISFSKIHHNKKYGIEVTDCNVINIISTQIEKNGDHPGGASVMARGVDALNLIGCYNEQNDKFPAPFLVLTKGPVHPLCKAVNLIGCRSIGNKKAPHSVVLEGADTVNFTGNVFTSFAKGTFVLRPLQPNQVRKISGQGNFLGEPLGDNIFALK
ncbi:MAG: hypothetical protein C4567_16200 [Deltaproteobacteria bacterium]|nr:MAG: hypothetical protein C4567_16200 [Deltaproteobacteria bacterium]